MKSKMFLFSLCIAAISTHAFAANEAEKTSQSSEEAVTEMKAQKRSILKTEENGQVVQLPMVAHQRGVKIMGLAAPIAATN
jgi:hypothetical protein